MKTFLKFLAVLFTGSTIFAASPFEYFPVATNMTLHTITSANSRIMGMLGGLTVTNDGYGGLFIFDTNSTLTVDGLNVFDRDIPNPTNITHTAGAGTLATATYYYRVSALTANGETLASTETSLAITGPAGVNVNWTMVPGATGYKVYGRATGAELFIAQVGQVGTYLDTGAITPSGALPGSNTSGLPGGRWVRLDEYLYGRFGKIGTLTVTNSTTTGSLAVVTNATVGGTLVVTGTITGSNISGSNTGDQTITLTGDATGSGTGTFAVVVDRLDGAAVPAAGALTTGNVLQVNGVSSLAYGPVQLGGGANYVQGTVQVENGGTEFVTATPNGVLYGNGTGAIQVTAQGAANTVLIANAGAPSFSAAITVGTSVTTPALIATTSLTTPAATISGLTAARFAIVDTGGLIITDSDFTWGTDTASFTKVLAPTSVSSPSYISTTSITQTPAAGNNFNVNLSTTGDFAVNTDDLYVDTSLGFVGIGTTAPDQRLEVSSVGTAADLALKLNGAVDKFVQLSFYENSNFKWGIYNNFANDNLQFGNGGGTWMVIQQDGNVGIGTATPLAKLAVNGGAAIGEDADPGDNNLKVVGLTTTGTLVVTTSSTHSYATASTVAVFDGSKNLVSSAVTTTTLGYLDATSSIQTQLNLRVREPKYGTVDPNFGTPVTGDDDGQMYVNTDTGERWWYYASGTVWLP